MVVVVGLAVLGALLSDILLIEVDVGSVVVVGGVI